MRKKLLLAALFLSLATGKWGAYLGISSLGLFLIDFIFFLAVLGSRSGKGINLRRVVIILFLTLQIVIAQTNQYTYQTYLRDLIPFIYILFIPEIAVISKTIPKEEYLRVLRSAPIFNAFWSTLSLLEIIPQINCSGFCGVPIFTLRSDQSAIVCAIGILAWGFGKDVKLTGKMLAISSLLFAALLPPSRTALLTASFAMVVVLYSNLSRRTRGIFLNTLKTTFVILLLGILTIASTRVINVSSSSMKSVTRLVTADYSGEVTGNSGGTIRARIIAQRQLLNWSFSKYNPLIGAGAGTEMVANSGSYRFLSSALDVRAPHSWWVNCLSRFGIIGLALWLWFITPLFRKRSFVQNDLSKVLSFGCLSIILTASFNVMIESPFGSLPLAILLGGLTSEFEKKPSSLRT